MKILTNFDLSGNELQNAVLQNLATAPKNPAEGQVYCNTVDHIVYIYLNGQWKNAVYAYTGETFTSALKLKLDGIASGATKVEKSETNGNLEINGTEVQVYKHPGSGTNPHGTTKQDVGLGEVENKSSATILNELTKEKIAEKLGFTPKEIKVGTDAGKGAATGSKIVYIATDTKKIWLDHATGSWLQVGGQDTIAWGNVSGKPTTFPPAAHNHDADYLGINGKAKSAEAADKAPWSGITGKPSAFTPPVASDSILGGVKVGANLKIEPDGTLSAVTGAGDGEHVYLVKQENFTATAGQTSFTLTNGRYMTGCGLLSVFLNGIKVRREAITETGNTTFTMAAGLQAGDQVLAEYVQIMDVEPYLSHGAEHVEGATDAIPNATQSRGGNMSAADKKKLDSVAEGANKYTHPSGDGNQHVPATGTSNNGKVLKAGATAGSASWGTVSKSEVGLSNVPNVGTNDQTPTYTPTSALAELVSGEKLSAAFGKLAKAVADLIAHLANKNNPHGVTKAQVGLGNVNNTSDADKPVSTAQQAALDKKLNSSLKGAANGLAELDSTGKVPAAQLPSYVDDVIEGYLSGGKFYKEPGHTTVITGESGKIYVDLGTEKTYRWSGTAFAVISDTIALGETSSTAYRGDRGKIAYDHSQSAHARTDATKTVNSATNGNLLINDQEVEVYKHPSSHEASIITQDAAHRFVSDTEKSSWNSRTKKYAADVGNGSATEFTITHNLGTQDVTVMLREKASPYNQVFCDVQIPNTTQIKLLFATAPVSGAYRVIVTG